MTFKNAYYGVKKLFTAEILALIAAGCLLISGAVILIQTSVATGIVSVILLAVAFALPVLGLIITLTGLYQASKDQKFFWYAFCFAILDLVLQIATLVMNIAGLRNGVGDDVINIVSQICGLWVLIFVVQGIMVLANKLNCPEIAKLGTSILILNVIFYGISVVATIIPLIMQASVSIAIIEGIMMLVSAGVQIAAFIVYLVYLAKAKTMLETH